MAVVCAGPKAILDVPATLEYLETRGVPVVAVGQDELPGLLRPEPRGQGAVVASPTSLAPRGSPPFTRIGPGQRDPRLRAGARGGRPAAEVARTAIERAIADADAARVAGPELTPWLLARIATITGGASVRANTALIVNNALVAGAARESAARLLTSPKITPVPPRCRWLHHLGGGEVSVT